MLKLSSKILREHKISLESGRAFTTWGLSLEHEVGGLRQTKHGLSAYPVCLLGTAPRLLGGSLAPIPPAGRTT